MLARIFSGAMVGLTGLVVEVEVDVASRGLPSFQMVGLPSQGVKESRQRVRSALVNSGAAIPSRRITVNLAPADLPKDGPAYDLPIAVGLLAASGQLSFDTDRAMFFGELSLDGTLRHTAGVLPMAMLARGHGFRELFVPRANAAEAAVVRGVTVRPVERIGQLVGHFGGEAGGRIPAARAPRWEEGPAGGPAAFDLRDIRGQEEAKRAMEIAAAGGHNVFLVGPPGAGKTMLARALPGILPAMTELEAVEVTTVYSISGLVPTGQTVMRRRPFRAPHHTASQVGLVGGGNRPRPGEISLAHRGVLFLDEFPEFPRSVLESIRQPLEDGMVTVSRAAGAWSYPAKFLLVAAANPCPCGWFGTEGKVCSCSPGAVQRYRARVSGPMMDRIDLSVALPAVRAQELSELPSGASSAQVRRRVQAAREIQQERFAGTPLVSNGEMGTREVRRFCRLEREARRRLQRLADHYGLSARGYHKVLKVARTIADLEGAEEITPSHLNQVVGFRATSW